jgi:hypothetical protein
MDMSAGYWAAVMEHLPEAAIVFDRFHSLNITPQKPLRRAYLPGSTFRQMKAPPVPF